MCRGEVQVLGDHMGLPWLGHIPSLIEVGTQSHEHGDDTLPLAVPFRFGCRNVHRPALPVEVGQPQ